MTIARFSKIPRMYFWIAGIVVALVLGGFLVWRQFFETYHFREVAPNLLYRDGLRDLEREFNNGINDMPQRPGAVVSLLDEHENQKEPFSLEHDFCRRSKLRYFNFPIALGGWPTTGQVRDFLKLTEDPKHQPVLVHCAQGVRRTGMMVAAYQMSVQKWDKQKTKDAIETFGHSDRTVNDIKRFIDIYDPQTRTVTQTLEKSDE
jgi:protein-tyrosine phosphatase